MVTIGSAERPVRVAIVGSGPSGFYTAQHLLARKNTVVSVDMFEKLPIPFGLVRYGVAPDHQKIKSVTKNYTKIAQNARLRFFGNVDVGRHLTIADLTEHFHQVVLTTGAQTDRQLGIPGEDLRGSHAATEFVAWYNGHPDYRHLTFDLGHERAIVVGVGNVAVDVARILCRTPEELARTDIADHALELLAESRVREVLLLGRRGPAQAAFTNTELKELGTLEGADAVTRPDEVELDETSRIELAASPSKTAEQKVEILQSYAQRGTGKPKKLIIRFLVSPVEILGDEQGAVRAIRMTKNELVRTADGRVKAKSIDRFEVQRTGLVFRSVGYRGVPIPGVPFLGDWGIVPNEKGRVLDPERAQPVLGLYVAGWIKRGPTGVIGTNKPDALESVESMMDDLQTNRILGPSRPGLESIDELLARRQPETFTFEDWERLDALEVAGGEARQRPRVKFLAVEEMQRALAARR